MSRKSATSSHLIFSIRGFFLKGLQRLPAGLFELAALLGIYTVLKGSIYYVIETIGVLLLSLSPRTLAQFHSDQEVLLQAVAILVSFWSVRRLFRSLHSPDIAGAMPRVVLRKQAGMHGRLVWIGVDGLLKGLVMASLFLGLTTLLGLTQFEMAVFLDFRGIWTVLPVLVGQFLSFLLWVASLEFLRRYLHRVLVLESARPMLGIVMTILSESYLLYQVFSKPGQEAGDALIVILCCLILAVAQLLWYRLGVGLPAKQESRLSILRFGMGFGFWSSLLFVFGWSMGSFRATSFVNLFPVGATSDFSRFFAADRPAFLILVVWSFGFSANLVMQRLVRSVFRIVNAQLRAKAEGALNLDVEELEFQH